MKHYAIQLITVFIFLFFLSSCGKVATFNIQSPGFDYNAVLSIYPSYTSEKALLIKSLKSSQTFKVKLNKTGYGKMVLSSGGDKAFWIYLDDNIQEIKFDVSNPFKYPVRSSTSVEGQEIIDYYQMEASMTKDLKDSVKLANEQMDNSTSENVYDAVKNLNKWTDRRNNSQLNVIQQFATAHPKSFFTLIIMDQDGLQAAKSKDYLALINDLDPEVKNSEQAKKMIAEIKRVSHLEAGSKMADVVGTDTSGRAFNPKILKKVNLFICWLSYDNPSRLNNVKLVQLYEKFKGNDVEFISISYDKYRKWWVSVIKDDKLSWPQYADLLGSKSPNRGNFSDYKAPYMFITNQSGIILAKDVGIGEMNLELETQVNKLSK